MVLGLDAGDHVTQRKVYCVVEGGGEDRRRWASTT